MGKELVQSLTPRCSCGFDLTIDSIQVTQTKQLCFLGVCERCDKNVICRMPLSEVYKLALGLERMASKPSSRPTDTKLRPPLRKDMSKEDALFLKAMHIQA